MLSLTNASNPINFLIGMSSLTGRFLLHPLRFFISNNLCQNTRELRSFKSFNFFKELQKRLCDIRSSLISPVCNVCAQKVVPDRLAQ